MLSGKRDVPEGAFVCQNGKVEFSSALDAEANVVGLVRDVSCGSGDISREHSKRWNYQIVIACWRRKKKAWLAYLLLPWSSDPAVALYRLHMDAHTVRPGDRS